VLGAHGMRAPIARCCLIVSNRKEKNMINRRTVFAFSRAAGEL
jgi:hypothetical protein